MKNTAHLFAGIKWAW